MYDPEEAKKSYLQLLKENGLAAGLSSGLIVVIWYLIGTYLGGQSVPMPLLMIGIFFFVYIIHGNQSLFAL